MRSRLASIVVAAGIALAACGGGSTSDGDLLSFQAEAVDGSTVDLGDFAGSDLVIWFWAPW